jgi:hypothetical protein
MTLVEEYLEHTKNYKEVYGDKTLVLMQVGSFYECYAIKKAKEFMKEVILWILLKLMIWL